MRFGKQKRRDIAYASSLRKAENFWVSLRYSEIYIITLVAFLAVSVGFFIQARKNVAVINAYDERR